MTATSVEIDSYLRRLLLAARTSKTGREGRRLTQEEAAERIGVSAVLYRNLENGYTPTTQVPTLVDICMFLDVDPADLDALGYSQVADSLRYRMKTQDTVIIDMRKLKGFTDEERQALEIIVAKYQAANGRGAA